MKKVNDGVQLGALQLHAAETNVGKSVLNDKDYIRDMDVNLLYPEKMDKALLERPRAIKNVSDYGSLETDRKLLRINESVTKLGNTVHVAKYGKKVFFKGLWDEYPVLKQARGHIFDADKNIIVRPFDKMFNYGERNTGLDLSDDTKIHAVEKVNGFLGNITYVSSLKEFIWSTTGTIDSDFVEMFQNLMTDELYKANVIDEFFDFLMVNSNMTFMFEVCHKNDPHIIEEDLGVYLIGGRHVETGQYLSETDLDSMTILINGDTDCIKRPKHFWTTVDELINEIVPLSNLEGYMARANNGDFLFKVKTPYYLTTKYLARGGAKKYDKIFDTNLEDFDEELQDVIIFITGNFSKEEWLDIEEHIRVVWIRNFFEGNAYIR